MQLADDLIGAAVRKALQAAPSASAGRSETA
jgi:hypothetical protein